jgi:ABC-type transport system substrate-binding protein
MVKADWEAIGVQVTIAIYEVADLNQQVIRERNFQALLFGSLIKTPSDLYPFWHSSQRAYPGLNISNYVSNELDKNLEVLRTDSDTLARAAAYDEVKREFKDEVPGIFLFAPDLIYVTQDKASANLPEASYSNSSRFALVHTWHRYAEKVWPKTYYKKATEIIENSIH